MTTSCASTTGSAGGSTQGHCHHPASGRFASRITGTAPDADGGCGVVPGSRTGCWRPLSPGLMPRSKLTGPGVQGRSCHPEVASVGGRRRTAAKAVCAIIEHERHPNASRKSRQSSYALLVFSNHSKDQLIARRSQSPSCECWQQIGTVRLARKLRSSIAHPRRGRLGRTDKPPHPCACQGSLHRSFRGQIH
jgi:hypothetical protein